MKACANWMGAFVSLAAFAIAQDPASVGENRHVNPGSVVVPPSASRGDYDVYDRLDIVDQQSYMGANGDAWSGMGILGAVFDLQAVDDVYFINSCCLNIVTRDFLCFFGNVPAEGCYVAVYAANDAGAPDETPDSDELVTDVWGSAFTDTVFGWLGLRISCRAQSCCPSQGYGFVDCQPHDETVGGDWYYAVRNAELSHYDMYMRDGGRGEQGYGTTTWRSSTDLGYGPGTISQAISGWCCGLQLRCTYQVTKVVGRPSIEGAPCAHCPFAFDEWICTDRCYETQECSQRLSGFSACADGASCRVVAELVACDIPRESCHYCDGSNPFKFCP